MVMEAAMAPGDEFAGPRMPEESAYTRLQETRNSIEEVVAKMLEIKKESKSKSELRELITQIFINFIKLRQENRAILLEEDRVKAETDAAKVPVDLTTLQLHNLLYEKNHYIKAIKACKDFKSKYPEIELVAEEVFMDDAPEDIKNTVLSNDAAHDLMLKRLNYELFQRKELCKLREKLENHKKSLLETIANRKKFLSSLPSHLKALKKASLPVQQQFGIFHTKRMKQHNMAVLLPPPLYVLYSQLLAQKEAFGENVDLEIVGSAKDAEAFAFKMANKDIDASNNGEHSRLEDEAAEDEDEGRGRQKRVKKTPPFVTSEGAKIFQAYPLKVITHVYNDDAPNPKISKLITLRFEYIIRLKIVCVGVDGVNGGPEKNILCNLFPDDTGVELPHQASKLFVGDDFVFDETRPSRPYRWAQHLAGIDFLPEVPPLLRASETRSDDATKSDVVVSGISLFRQQNRVQKIIQRIRARKKAQISLAEQLDSFSKLTWPFLAYQNVPWNVHQPSCQLDLWSQVGPTLVASASPEPDLGKPVTLKEEVESGREDGELPVMKPDIECLISKSLVPLTSRTKSLSFKSLEDDLEMFDVGSDTDDPSQIGLDLGKQVSVKEDWASYGVREFHLTLARKMDENDVKMEAKVEISTEYPLRPPVFRLRKDSSESIEFCSCNELHGMEAEINVHVVRMLPREEENYVLAHQVMCLAMLFDLYAEDAACSENTKRSTSVVDIGLSHPVSGMLLARSFRGRDRRKMLSWKDRECTSGFPY